MKLVHSSQFTVHSKDNSVNHQLLTLNRNGQMLVIALIFLAVVMILAASLFSRTAGFLRFGSKSISQEQALNLAEAGIERTLWKLNETAGACSDCTQEYTIGTTGTFKVTIQEKTPPNPNLKTIISTGYIPNSTTPRVKQTIKVDVIVNTQGTSFHYAIQTREGGVSMANSSLIKGNVYSNGTITGTGSSQIQGDAYAFGTIDDPPCTPPTCIEHEGEPKKDPPEINYQFWKDAAVDPTKGGQIIDCSKLPSECNISNVTKSIGYTRYINGDLTISNQAVVTLQGPIHVVGNLIVRNGSTQVILDESFGANGTVLITDGTVTVEQGATFNPTSAKGYIMVVTTSTDPQAVQISQSGATAIFYALEGGGILSQTAKVSTLVANSLTMTQNSQLEYESGLADARFSTGPGGSWQIKKGTYRFTSSP